MNRPKFNSKIFAEENLSFYELESVSVSIIPRKQNIELM